MEHSVERFPNNRSLIFYFLKGSAHLFLISWVFSALVWVLALINPRVIEYVIDHIIAEGRMDQLPAAIGLIVLLSFMAFGCRYAFRFLNGRAAERFIRRMRESLYDHIIRLPFSWHNANATGDIIQRCTSDVELIKNFLAEHTTSLVRIVTLIILAISFMSQIDWRLTLISAGFIPVIVLFSYTFHSRIASSFRDVDEMEGRLSAVAQENLTGVRVVRAFGRERRELEKFVKMNNEYCGKWTHLMRLLSMFWCALDLIGGLQVLAVISAGAYLCVHGQILTGQYVQFVLYNSIMAWPVRMLGRVISEMSKAGISIERLRYIMNSDMEPEFGNEDEKKHSTISDLHGDIVFDNVSFSYENEPTLSNISFTVKEGETVGILGKTGSGKSTLMYLLERLYPIEEGCGRITIGGTDIRDIRRDTLRESIGMVLQEPYLFSGTLQENIGITQRDPDENSIREVSKTAMLTETIDRLTKGYDTFVGERGVTLSGGQKQRVAIAQMLMRKAPIMVFDDSLSAVDTETDAKIREALAVKSADATVILIAHRISSLMSADKIIVMDDGHIVETGTHDELVKNGGLYAQIYELQSGV